MLAALASHQRHLDCLPHDLRHAHHRARLLGGYRCLYPYCLVPTNNERKRRESPNLKVLFHRQRTTGNEKCSNRITYLHQPKMELFHLGII